MSLNNPSSKTQKLHFLTQIILRFMAIVTTLAAASLMLSNKENTVVFGIQVDARYSYSPAFKFFAFANMVTFVLSFVSLVFTFFMGKQAMDATYNFLLFLHDLVMTVLLTAATAAALAIAYVGKYGNSHTGWIPICDDFGKFCNKSMASLIIGFLGLATYLILTIFSAKKLGQVQNSESR